jgi:hypothetical protein
MTQWGNVMTLVALSGLVAGFLAAVVFHQGTIFLSRVVSIPFAFSPWNLEPIA